jgi:uncharacterized spore protein YtfJ
MSDQKLTEIVSSLLEGVHGISRSQTIVGKAQQVGDATVIPVHRLKVAFGAGSASAGAHGTKVGGKTGAGGAGGAVELDPVAAITVDKHGQAQLLSVDADASATWAHLMEEVPEMLAKVAQALGDRVSQELKAAPTVAELQAKRDPAENDPK